MLQLYTAPKEHELRSGRTKKLKKERERKEEASGLENEVNP